jgi:hypothetical protein
LALFKIFSDSFELSASSLVEGSPDKAKKIPCLDSSDRGREFLTGHNKDCVAASETRIFGFGQGRTRR